MTFLDTTVRLEANTHGGIVLHIGDKTLHNVVNGDWRVSDNAGATTFFSEPAALIRALHFIACGKQPTKPATLDRLLLTELHVCGEGLPKHRPMIPRQTYEDILSGTIYHWVAPGWY